MLNLFTHHTITTLLIMLSIAAIPGHAADRTLAPARILTRDELRVCMDASDRIAERRKALERLKPAHDAETLAITAKTKALAAELAHIDTRDEDKIREYNERVRRHDNVVAEHNKRAKTMNADSEALNAESAHPLDQCSLPYRFADQDAILNERRKASAIPTHGADR
jgi:hypothetical protein